ncbi:MAG TPA: DedA family protein, partial [Synergistaceae bacterium]|nr:DedA family protein [Synergistaceae bacterium]
VGLLVPGTVIMFSVGTIVATGSLRLLPVLLMAMSGAVMGDGASYWLGHHYKDRLMHVWPFSRYPGMLKKGEEFFLRQGGKSVLFGRFVGPVRPVIPVVAGMLGMAPLRFSVVNILSAIGWALAYILPGVFFGTSLGVIKIVSTRLAVLVLIAVASIWGLVWLSRKTVSLFERQGPIWLAALQRWATTEPPHQGRVPGFFKRILSKLLFSERRGELLASLFVLVLFAAVWGCLDLLEYVLAKDPLIAANQAVYHFFQSLRTVWSDSIFVVISELGDPFVNVVLFCTVLLLLLVKRCYRADDRGAAERCRRWHSHRRKSFQRFAEGISRRNVFYNAGILPSLLQRQADATTGCTKWLDSQPGDFSASNLWRIKAFF